MNKLISYAVMAAVGVLVFSALLVPVINGAQTVTGDPVTYENETSVTLRGASAGDVLHAFIDTDDNNAKKITLNGVEIESFDTLTFADACIISDSLYMQVDPTRDTNYLYLSSLVSGGASWWSDCTIEFTATTIRIHGTSENGAIDETHNYSWGYVICNPANGTYCASVAGGTGYVNTTKDVILCGMYLTGDNDTPYVYKNGVFTTSQWTGTKSVNVDMEKVSGTTDIYTATVDVDIGDENFTPYRIYLPLEVHGHADHGAVYSMLGVIPLIVIVGLIVGIVGVVAIRRNN